MALMNGFQQKYDSLGLSVERLDGSKITPQDLHAALGSVGLFTQKRLVVVDDFCARGKAAQHAPMLEYIESKNVPEDNVLIFVEPVNKHRGKLFQSLKKGKHVESFEKLGTVKLYDWIRKEFARHETTIDAQVVPLLVQRVGNDLWRLSHEIHKLASFRKKGSIAVDDIRELVNAAYDDNIFHLTDAIAAQQSAAALKLVEHQMQLGASPQSILSRLHWQIRILRDARNIEPFTESAIRDALKVHPYVAKKTFAATQKFTPKQLDAMYHSLLATDAKLKTTSVDPKAVLGLCVVDLCRAD